MVCRTHPDRDSVFGNTYCGVPNPQVPHRHPYPTRFHGRVPYQPQAFLPYRVRPYAQAPFMAAAKPMQPWELRGIDDLGGVDWPVLGAVAVGAAVGAAIGIPSVGKAHKPTVAAAAALGAGIAGALGLAMRVQSKVGGG